MCTSWSVQQLPADLLDRQKNCEQLAAYLAKKIKQSHQDSKMFAELIRTEVPSPLEAALLSVGRGRRSVWWKPPEEPNFWGS